MREGTIKLTLQDSGKELTIKVTQQPKEVEYSYTFEYSGGAKTKSLTFQAGSNNQTIQIISTTEPPSTEVPFSWSDLPDWITIQDTDAGTIITVTDNTTGAERNAEITFTQQVSSYTLTLNIKQLAHNFTVYWDNQASLLLSLESGHGLNFAYQINTESSHSVGIDGNQGQYIILLKRSTDTVTLSSVNAPIRNVNNQNTISGVLYNADGHWVRRQHTVPAQANYTFDMDNQSCTYNADGTTEFTLTEEIGGGLD